MINKNENQIELKFGTGDICVNPGYCLDNGNNKIGVIAFSNQSSREIGTEGVIPAGGKCDLDYFPVIMTFSKKESIDAIIKALQDTKADMEFSCEKEGE